MLLDLFFFFLRNTQHHPPERNVRRLGDHLTFPKDFYYPVHVPNIPLSFSTLSHSLLSLFYVYVTLFVLFSLHMIDDCNDYFSCAREDEGEGGTQK